MATASEATFVAGDKGTRDQEIRSTRRKEKMGALFSVDASQRGKTAKRKGSSVDSGPRTRSKVAKEGSEEKTIAEHGVEDECDQLRREYRALERERFDFSEEEFYLEQELKEDELDESEIEDEMEEQLEELRRELYQSEQDWIPKRNRLRVLCEPMEVENAQHLDKLPREVWEKILDHLEEDDLFPLALSCRYFRQKQQELVARPRQSGKPRRALKTHLEQKLRNRQPASVEYLRFCCKEKGCFGFGIDPESYVQDRNILCLAAYHGHLPLLQELLLGLDERYRRSVFPSRFPSRFFSRGSKDLQEIADSAGESPSSIITFFVSSSLFYLLTSLFLFFTASAGHLETLRWLNSKGWLNLDLAILSTACMIGHLEMVQWLRSEGCPFEEKMWAPGEPCSSAAYGGHLEVLRWLRSEGCDWSESTCSNAARNGHLEVLKWLRSEGCPWSEETSWKAAKGGHLEVLKWLRSEGCPWNERTCEAAAEGGRLEVLKWLRSEGCPWDGSTWKFAAESVRE